MNPVKSNNIEPTELAKSDNMKLAESAKSNYIEFVKRDYIRLSKIHDTEPKKQNETKKK